MKTSTTISSLARIYVSSIKFGGAGRYFALGESFGSFAGPVWAHLYPHASEANLRKLGNHLAAVARSAHLARQPDIVEWATRAIVDLPLPSEFRSMADFYGAYRQRQQGEINGSRIIFARIAEEAAPGFRERAILALGTSYLHAGNLQEAGKRCLDAAHAARGGDLVTHAQAFWNLAIVRSVDGDHRGALRDLERLAPTIRMLGQQYPTLHCDYLNSLAVEMSAVGRNEEARQIINRLLALPAAKRSPSWRETAKEIAINEARGVPCPLTFAVGMPAKHAPPADEDRRLNRSSDRTGIDASTDCPLPSVTRDICAPDPAPTVSESGRSLPLCDISLSVAVSTAETAIARSVANLPTALAPTATGCLPWRPDETPRARLVRNPHLESVLVPGEYPRFPLPRSYP